MAVARDGWVWLVAVRVVVVLREDPEKITKALRFSQVGKTKNNIGQNCKFLLRSEKMCFQRIYTHLATITATVLLHI